MKSTRLLIPFLVLFCACEAASAATPPSISNVLESGKKLDDPRLGRQRTLKDRYHPWTPASTMAEWEKQSKDIRERVLVSAGLWPMPPKTPLKPVIHGKIDRGDYTVEKVYFASLPGHYVTGNLYRPKHISGKVPGVLSPHGHWEGGRFHDDGETKAREHIAEGGESTMAGARFFLQARAVGLARLGCVVFHYDMVGMGDSKPIPHGGGFSDAEAELRLQSALGLQTFNSIRALDFLTSLPEVDSKRIGVTGESGGGTQTFMLDAVDPRPTVAFPAVMVSTNMQGGCVCETADLLRVGINNVAIAALFAPKPIAMSGAHDWTIDIERKGLPELKQVYGLYGSADKVTAKAFPQFHHNYNQVAREMMDNWFNTYLHLGHKSPVVERDFTPVDPKDLSVFDAHHPLPRDAKTVAQFRKYLTSVANKQYSQLLPKDAAGLEHYREVVGTAARVMLDGKLPGPEAIDSEVSGHEKFENGVRLLKGISVRSDDHSQMPWVLLHPETPNGSVVLWLDGKGKSHLFGADGKPTPAVQKLLDRGNSVVSVDLYLTGEFVEPGKPVSLPKVNAMYGGYTFAYNRPVIANRVHDILTAVIGLLKTDGVNKITLVGTGEAGPCVLLAAGLLKDQVSEVIADAHGLSYRSIPATSDQNFLPGALKYGGLGGLVALAAPTKLTIFGTEAISPKELEPLAVVYKIAGGTAVTESKPLTPELVAEKCGR